MGYSTTAPSPQIGGPLKTEEMLERFHQEMLAKLKIRDEKQGEKSVMRYPPSQVLTDAEMWGHFGREITEFNLAPNDETEAVDVANMAFILWWSIKEKKGGAVE